MVSIITVIYFLFIATAAVFTIPKFVISINSSDDVRFSEGDSFTLTSTATGKFFGFIEVDIRWLFRGLYLSTGRRKEDYNNISSDLTFTNVTSLDDGIYEALLVWNNQKCSSYHSRSPLNLNRVVLAKAKVEVNN